MAQDIEQALQILLAKEFPSFESLVSCRKLTAGASQETYQVVIDIGAQERSLALRRAVPTLQSQSELGTITLEVEAKLFQLAAAGGIPEPEILYVLREADNLGSGFIMEWLEGETLGNRIVRHEDFALLREDLAYQCGSVLARVHALDWRDAGLDSHLSNVSPEALVNETWSYYRDIAVSEPMIDFTGRWLLDHLPENSQTALVHGDFRNGNLMVTPNGIAAVLDWELAHVGDPVRDLGWLCVNSWRFGNSEKSVGGFGHVDDLLAGYYSVSGQKISPEHLKFWQVFGSFWWSIICLRMAQSWRTGETPSLERPAIGRRSSEAQMDCVNLLIPGSFNLPEPRGDLADGAQLPMAAELLRSVSEFLRDEILHEVTAENAFLSRVAANSLDIVQREVLYGPILADEEKQRLQSLLTGEAGLDTLRWELVEKLRNHLPLGTPGLAEHLRETVAGQLSIDQPKYSGLVQSPAA
ncbi:MAG: aminoglycoside phosphotransferase (APT) family kinase protein [Halioglobus sp.]|jgi:aminoglycoside phosphotransferase (APT) family kinase protein